MYDTLHVGVDNTHIILIGVHEIRFGWIVMYKRYLNVGEMPNHSGGYRTK